MSTVFSCSPGCLASIESMAVSIHKPIGSVCKPSHCWKRNSFESLQSILFKYVFSRWLGIKTIHSFCIAPPTQTRSASFLYCLHVQQITQVIRVFCGDLEFVETMTEHIWVSGTSASQVISFQPESSLHSTNKVLCWAFWHLPNIQMPFRKLFLHLICCWRQILFSRCKLGPFGGSIFISLGEIGCSVNIWSFSSTHIASGRRECTCCEDTKPDFTVLFGPVNNSLITLWIFYFLSILLFSYV